MDKIIDLKNYKSGSFADEMEVEAGLEALMQITQEINIVLQVWKQDGISINKTLDRLKDKTGNEYFYMLSSLCTLHGKNLLNIAGALTEKTAPISMERREELEKKIHEMPLQYWEQSIMMKTLEKYIETLDELDTEESTDK